MNEKKRNVHHCYLIESRSNLFDFRCNQTNECDVGKQNDRMDSLCILSVCVCVNLFFKRLIR